MSRSRSRSGESNGSDVIDRPPKNTFPKTNFRGNNRVDPVLKRRQVYIGDLDTDQDEQYLSELFFMMSS